MEIEIVKPLAENWDQIRALRIRSVSSDPEAFGQTPEEAIATPEEEWRRRLNAGQYMCARDTVTKEILAMACVVQEENEKSKHIANIYSVYVSPEVRGHGVGRRIMESLIEDVIKTMPEVIKLELRVSSTQQAAKALYESLGFKEIGLLEKELLVNGKYVDEFEMHKFIRDL